MVVVGAGKVNATKLGQDRGNLCRDYFIQRALRLITMEIGALLTHGGKCLFTFEADVENTQFITEY